MTDDPLEQLAADYPDWRIRRHADGAYIGWLPGTMPPLRFREAAVSDLRDQIAAHENTAP
jgi:hypothetical protein